MHRLDTKGLCLCPRSPISYFSLVSRAYIRFIRRCPLEALPQQISVPVKQKGLKSDQLHPLLWAMWHRYEGDSSLPPCRLFSFTPKQSAEHSPAWRVCWLPRDFSSSFLTWGAGSSRGCICDGRLGEREREREREMGREREREMGRGR